MIKFICQSLYINLKLGFFQFTGWGYIQAAAKIIHSYYIIKYAFFNATFIKMMSLIDILFYFILYFIKATLVGNVNRFDRKKEITT